LGAHWNSPHLPGLDEPCSGCGARWEILEASQAQRSSMRMTAGSRRADEYGDSAPPRRRRGRHRCVAVLVVPSTRKHRHGGQGDRGERLHLEVGDVTAAPASEEILRGPASKSPHLGPGTVLSGPRCSGAGPRRSAAGWAKAARGRGQLDGVDRFGQVSSSLPRAQGDVGRQRAFRHGDDPGLAPKARDAVAQSRHVGINTSMSTTSYVVRPPRRAQPGRCRRIGAVAEPGQPVPTSPSGFVPLPSASRIQPAGPAGPSACPVRQQPDRLAGAEGAAVPAPPSPALSAAERPG